MSDLRKVAEELIKEWDWECGEHQNKALAELIEALRQSLAQPEQKPVAWMKTWSDGNRNLYLYKPPHFDDNEIDPLYTALPKREWIDLTEDEAFACRGLDFFDTYKNINAKLKEKNT